MILEAFLVSIGWNYLAELIKADEKTHSIDPAKAVGSLLASFTGDYVSAKVEKFIDEAAQIIKRHPLPVNKALMVLVRTSFLASAREASLFCHRNELMKDADEKKMLKHLSAYFLTEIARIKKDADRPGVMLSDDTKKYLELSKFSEDLQIEDLEGCINYMYDTLAKEISAELFARFNNDTIPDCYRDTVLNGWKADGNGFNFLAYMSDYFNALLDKSPRIQEFIKGQWLARLTRDSQHIQEGMQTFRQALEASGRQSLVHTGMLNEILHFVNPQPLLKFDFTDENRTQQTLYRTRFVPFFGRKNELTELINFFENDTLFAWWVVIGQGGTGKSRLAMELCFEISASYTLYAGFIERDNLKTGTFDETTWQPQCKTLMIIDYASLSYERIITILKNLKDRKQSLRYPVRILLLERELNGIWWDDFQKAFSMMEDIPRPWKTPMLLGDLSADDLWDIFTFTLEHYKCTIPDKEKTLMDLWHIDSQGRPLFALFAALALAHGHDIKGWNKIKLLDIHLARENDKIWKHACPDPQKLNKHKRLVTLATMGGGYEQKEMDQVLDKRYEWLPTRNEMSVELFGKISAVVYEDKYRFKAMEPDILGEYFVIRQFAPGKYDVFRDQAPIRELIEEAWREKLFETIFFTLRAFQDFYDHEQVELLIEVLENSTHREHKNWWQVLVIDIIGIYCKSGELAKALSLFNRLSLIDAKQNKDIFHQRQAKALRNIVEYRFKFIQLFEVSTIVNQVLVRNRTPEMYYVKGLFLSDELEGYVNNRNESKTTKALADLEKWVEAKPTEELFLLLSNGYAYAIEGLRRVNTALSIEYFDRFVKFTNRYHHQILFSQLIASGLGLIDYSFHFYPNIYPEIKPLFQKQYGTIRLLEILDAGSDLLPKIIFGYPIRDRLERVSFCKELIEDIESMMGNVDDLEVLRAWSRIILEMAFPAKPEPLLDSWIKKSLGYLWDLCNKHRDQELVLRYGKILRRCVEVFIIDVTAAQKAFLELNRFISPSVDLPCQEILWKMAEVLIYHRNSIGRPEDLLDALEPYYTKQIDKRYLWQQLNSLSMVGKPDFIITHTDKVVAKDLTVRFIFPLARKLDTSKGWRLAAVTLYALYVQKLLSEAEMSEYSSLIFAVCEKHQHDRSWDDDISAIKTFTSGIK